MIFALPCGIFAFQEAQQLLPSNFLTRRFDQEGAAPSRTYQGINFPEQVFGQQNVGALSVRMHILSVPLLCAFVKTLPGQRVRNPLNLPAPDGRTRSFPTNRTR
jgi:hypothetical protein